MLLFAVLLIVPALTFADPIEDLENKIWALLDADKDGKVTEVEGETYFLGYDTDKDGKLSPAEFKAGVDKVDALLAGQEDKLFVLFDRNNDKSIEKSDIDATFAYIDLNHDGSIDKTEYQTTFHVIVSILEGGS